MDNKECKLVYEDYTALRAKEKKWLRENDRLSLSAQDVLKTKKLAEELVSRCQSYIEDLPATDRFDIRKVAQG